jgi:hypothetical protein
MATRSVRTFATVVLSLFLAAHVHAQQDVRTIVLKDGSVIKGTILRQTADTLEVAVADSVIKVPTANVRRIHNVGANAIIGFKLNQAVSGGGGAEGIAIRLK